MHELVAQDETLDVLCSESLKIIQKRNGYRFSIDSILLANFVTLKPGEPLLDIGSGCGIIPFYLCSKGFRNPMVGIEIQEELHLTAMKNKALNDCGNVSFIRADVRESRDLLRTYGFRVVVSNPPFRARNTGRTSPGRSRLLARSEVTLSLSAFFHLAASIVDLKGRVYTIYPAQRIAEVIAAASDGKLELKRLRFVHPKGAEPSNLFLAEFLKGAGPGATVQAPLYIYTDGDYSNEVKTYYDPFGGAHGNSPQTH
jgi:tRNA1Val (adenine37-N6)-methyltransferase